MSAPAEAIRILAKWLMFRVLCLGDARRYHALRGAVARAAARGGCYERRQIAFLRRVLAEGSVAVDGGAGFGAYSAPMARLVGRSGRVIAFEPLPEVFAELERAMRRRANVSCRRQALSDRDGGAELHVPLLWGSLPEPALASVERPPGPHDACRVELVRLDALAGEIGRCDFVKLDVEGHEHEALRGGAELIARERPLIQLESNDLRRDGPGYRSFAAPLGYELCELGPGGELRPCAANARGPNFYLVPSGWRPLDAASAASAATWRSRVSSRLRAAITSARGRT